MGVAPVGYSNKISETGRKYIAVREDEACIMRWAFGEIASGMFNTQQIWKMACVKGLKCSKNSFWNAIRNPLYCGKVFVPKHKEEEGCLVQGQHEPLISEALFYEVQDVLDGRKKTKRTTVMADPNLPLRGFLLCPRCGKILTGSASKGRTNYYHYYHCSSSCGFRHKAPEANEMIVDEIRKYVKPLGTLSLYKEVISSVYKNKTKNQRSDVQQLKVQLEGLNKRLSKARDLLLGGDIEPDDYRTIKSETEERINRIEAKITEIARPSPEIGPLLDMAFANISQLDVLYRQGTVLQQRKIIGSMFPEKLTFDGFGYRTEKVNEALRLMLLFDKGLQGKKNGTNQNFSELSQDVEKMGFEPTTSWLPAKRSSQVSYIPKADAN